MLINKQAGCYGVKLFRYGKYQIELIYCPSSIKTIPIHNHPLVDIKFIYLFGICLAGKEKLNGEKKSLIMKFPWDVFKVFDLRAGEYHWFDNLSGIFPIILINVEKWLSKPTSTAENYIEKV